jgi:hypothetical protein
VKPGLLHALVVAGTAIATGALLSHWGLALPLLMAMMIVIAVVAYATPWIGVRWLDHLILLLRTWLWRDQHGRHHSFGGIALYIEDDGRYAWVGADGLQRVLHLQETEDVFAARHPGRWRRDDDGRLMIRADAVVERLNTAPGRTDPRTLKLRQYLQREVLFPAAQKRSRQS